MKIEMVEAVASQAVYTHGMDKGSACTVLGNCSFSLFIYNSYAISLNNNIISIYIMDLIWV